MHEVKMPQMGQSVEEASIVKWFKKEGDRVTAGEPLFSIQTDKAEVECEAPAAGVLRKILLEPDVLVPVLTVIALVGEPDEPLPAGVATAVPTPALASEAKSEPDPAAAATPAPQPLGGDGGRLFASPRARAAAETRGLDLAAITGSGVRGRITEADILARAEVLVDLKVTPTARRVAANKGVDLARIQGTGIGGKITKADVAGAVTPAVPAPPAAPKGSVQRVPLSKMRSIIARRMSDSIFTAPHYYITVEVDMTAAKAYRAACTAFTPSFNDFVLRAAVKALRDFPGVNARWAGDAIEIVADINLGIAVSLPNGLIVPVLKQAQDLSLEQVAAGAKALVEKARNGKLLPDDFTGNTFTVSNLGPFGVDHFTAIINQPDSAILAVGQMKDRPVVIEGGIYIRPIMKMTISSDHRVIDGSVAAQFMARMREILEAADF